MPTPTDRPRPGPALATRHPTADPAVTDTPGADIRIGYARCSHLTQELQSQLDALNTHGIGRDKIFSEKISTRIRVRPQFEAALATARQIKAHATHCRVLFTVCEMKRHGRDAAELTALADHLTAHGLVLEMLAGPLPGIYEPSGPGRMLFGFFAAMAETERESIREATLEGLDAAARKGRHRRPTPGRHRRHAAHRAPPPRDRRVRRADAARGAAVLAGRAGIGRGLLIGSFIHDQHRVPVIEVTGRPGRRDARHVLVVPDRARQSAHWPRRCAAVRSAA